MHVHTFTSRFMATAVASSGEVRIMLKRRASEKRSDCKVEGCDKVSCKCPGCLKRILTRCTEHTAALPLREALCDYCSQRRVFWCHGCNKDVINPPDNTGASIDPYTLFVTIPGYVRPAPVKKQDPPEDQVESSDDDDRPSDEFELTLCDVCANNVDGSARCIESFTCKCCRASFKKEECYALVMTLPPPAGTAATVLKPLTEEEEDMDEHDKPVQEGQLRLLFCRSCASDLLQSAGVDL